MIELSITAKNAAPPPPATAVSAGAPGGFARAFDAISDAPPAAQPAAEPRQGDADSGKDLPAAAADPADETPAAPAKPATPRRHARATAEPVPPGDMPPTVPAAPQMPSPDSDDPAADPGTPGADTDKTAPIMAFMATPFAPILIDPSKLPAPAPGGVGSAMAGAAPVTPDASLAVRATPAAPAATSAPKDTTTLPAAFELIDAGLPAKTPTPPADPTAVTAPRIEARTDTPRFTIAPAPVDATPATAAVQPARQAFATALAALSARALARDDDNDDAQQPIAGLVTPTAGTLLQNAVQQVAAGDQAALDPRHDRGLHGMIDHIEMLRDDADARDTRIRLTPDALGTVDVALRRDGDAVHVRFSSANEATRLVLNDAQPRLAALAETRGVRIAGSSVDSGASDGWGGGGQPQPQPRTESTRPARAPRATAAADTDIPADQRLA